MIDQHWTLTEKFLKKGFWLYLFSFIIGPIWYITKIIISSELTVSEVWILYWIISLITMLSAYNDLWMTESLKHFIPEFVTKKRYDKVKSILFYALFMQILTSLIIASFFFFGTDFIAEHYFKTDAAKDTLKIFAFFFIGTNIFQTINQFFLAVQNTFYLKLSDFIRTFFVMFSVLFIFFWDYSSLVNYSYSWLIGLYIWILWVLFIFYQKYYKKYFVWQKFLIQKKLIKQFTKYASLVLLWTSVWTLLGQIDMQMIIYILWTTDAWYYTNYLSIIWIPFLLIWPIFQLLFPVFSELHSKKEHNKIKLIKQIFSNNFIMIAIMFNIFFFVFAEIIAYTLFWEKFITSWTILKYSILFLIFNFLLQINGNILAWIGRVSLRVKITIIAVCFNLVTNIIFINIIWVYGAALATWMGWILIYTLQEIFLWVRYRINYYYFTIIKNIIVMWWLWFAIHKYWLVFMEWISRINSFFLLWWIFVIWFLIFVVINLGSFKIFVREVRKLKG